MTGDDPFETLTELLETNRSVYRYLPASESLRSSNFTTAASGVLAAMQPADRYRTALAKRYPDKFTLANCRTGGAIGAGVLVVIVGVLWPGALEWLPRVIDLALLLEGLRELPRVTRREALLFVWLLPAGAVGAVAGSRLYRWVMRTHRPPQHGPTGSLYLGTPGDGTVTIDYQFPEAVEPTFETQFNEITDRSQIREANMTLDSRLGAIQPADSDETNPWADADRTPHVGRLVFQSTTPYEPLKTEPSPEAILETNDFGLPTDEIIRALATQAFPAAVVVTAAAREHEPRRAQRINVSQSEVATGRTEATEHLLESTRAEPDELDSPAPATLFDISIRLLCFPTAEDNPDALCEQIKAAIAGSVYANSVDIAYQLVPIGSQSRFRLIQRRRSRVLLTRLRDETVPVRGFSQYFTGVPGVGFHVQPSFPVTGRGFWLYFGVTGKGLETAANAQATKNLDQTQTGTPPESVLQELRKRVDGTIFAPAAYESPHDPDAAHTATGQTADPDSGATDSAASNTAAHSDSPEESETAGSAGETPPNGGSPDGA